jgi:hypothetical protein
VQQRQVLPSPSLHGITLLHRALGHVPQSVDVSLLGQRCSLFGKFPRSRI